MSKYSKYHKSSGAPPAPEGEETPKPAPGVLVALRGIGLVDGEIVDITLGGSPVQPVDLAKFADELSAKFKGIVTEPEASSSAQNYFEVGDEILGLWLRAGGFRFSTPPVDHPFNGPKVRPAGKAMLHVISAHPIAGPAIRAAVDEPAVQQANNQLGLWYPVRSLLAWMLEEVDKNVARAEWVIADNNRLGLTAAESLQTNDSRLQRMMAPMVEARQGPAMAGADRRAENQRRDERVRAEEQNRQAGQGPGPVPPTPSPPPPTPHPPVPTPHTGHGQKGSPGSLTNGAPTPATGRRKGRRPQKP